MRACSGGSLLVRRGYRVRDGLGVCWRWGQPTRMVDRASMGELIAETKRADAIATRIKCLGTDRSRR